MSSRRQKLLARANWYLQFSLKHITELITGNKSYYRGGRYKQVSLYLDVLTLMCWCWLIVNCSTCMKSIQFIRDFNILIFFIPWICYERNFSEFYLSLYMKPISFQSKASVVCSVTAAIFIGFCLKKVNVFSQHIGKKNKQMNIWIPQNK